MNNPSLNTEEIFHSSMLNVRKAIKQIVISSDYKLIKSNNSFEVFRILMNNEDVFCLIYCSFFTIDSFRVNGIFKVSNLSNGSLSEQELITLRNDFIKKFKLLLEVKPLLSKNYLQKIKENVNQNSILPTLKPFNSPSNIESRKLVSLSNYPTKNVNNGNKIFWIFLWIIIILLAVVLSKNGKMIHVDSYERTNGTHVHSYDRKP